MINFCMAFWTDGQENSTREYNVKLTWNYLKQMIEFLNRNEVMCSAKLFDYSPEKIIDDAIHIPYPLGVYKRSEKLNNIIYSLPDDEYVCLMDCDVFIHRMYWSKLKTLLQDVKYESGYFFNFAKFDILQVNNLDEITLNHPHNLAFAKGNVGGFGGFHITSVKAIKDVGAYDTKFTTWGGEDGHLMDRYYQRFLRIGISEEEILPFHLPHFSDRSNILYFNHEEYVKNNNL